MSEVVRDTQRGGWLWRIGLKKGQEVHDAKVREVARRLEREGYDVQADLPGHARPPAMGGHVPDIVASKPGKTLVFVTEHAVVTRILAHLARRGVEARAGPWAAAG